MGHISTHHVVNLQSMPHRAQAKEPASPHPKISAKLLQATASTVQHTSQRCPTPLYRVRKTVVRYIGSTVKHTAQAHPPLSTKSAKPSYVIGSTVSLASTSMRVVSTSCCPSLTSIAPGCTGQPWSSSWHCAWICRHARVELQERAGLCGVSPSRASMLGGGGWELGGFSASKFGAGGESA